MTFFSNNPFTKILFFWLSGLLCGFFFPWLKIELLILFGILALLALCKLKSKQYPFDLYMSATLSMGFMLLAFISVPPPEIIHENQSQHYWATVLEYPTEKPKTYQCQVRIELADSAYFNHQKIVVYFEKTDAAHNLAPGNQLIISSKLQRINNSGDPFGFDYQQFMSNRNIYYSSYISADNFVWADKETQKSLPFLAEKFRNKLIVELKQYISNDESLQVISALTQGYRKELSAETRSYFASTGAMHVLAVSGLHVGMIFLFLSNLLAFLKRYRFGALFFVLSIGSLLWFYALLTGLSPSVLRATVMFSFILIGNSLRRPTSIYNSIAASAFLLLLFNPKMIFEVGFQLSYAAVISIVFFFPRLEKLLTPRSFLFRKIWQLTCVSIAAQFGTVALSVFYFHQFPLFFWLSNLLVIPAAYLILGGTFLFFLVYPINVLATLTAAGLSGITYLITFLLRKIDQLPFSLIENIPITKPQLLFLFAIGISLIFFIKLKQKSFFFAAIGFYLFFLVGGIIQKIQLINQQKCIIYARNDCIHLINGRQNYLIIPSSKNPQEQALNNTIRELQLEEPLLISLDSCQHYYQDDLIIDQLIILFLDQTFQFEKRKENRYRKDFIEKGKSKISSNSFKLVLKTKIDSAMKKGKIIN